MPRYLFRCWCCGELTLERRSVEQRNDPADCPNCMMQASANREFSVPQLITQPFHLAEDNNPYPGLSGTDVVAEMKREDAEYEKLDYSSIPKKRTTEQVFADMKPMREVFQETLNA